MILNFLHSFCLITVSIVFRVYPIAVVQKSLAHHGFENTTTNKETPSSFGKSLMIQTLSIAESSPVNMNKNPVFHKKKICIVSCYIIKFSLKIHCIKNHLQVQILALTKDRMFCFQFISLVFTCNTIKWEANINSRFH